MTVYDVVIRVRPGAQTSTLPGRWLIAFFTGNQNPDRANLSLAERKAEEFANRCQECAWLDGITYHVEEHDDLSPARAMYEADYRRGERYGTLGDNPDHAIPSV